MCIIDRRIDDYVNDIYYGDSCENISSNRFIPSILLFNDREDNAKRFVPGIYYTIFHTELLYSRFFDAIDDVLYEKHGINEINL